MTTANRGKVAESLVKKMLQGLEAANCAHIRMPDAHAGSLAVTPSDFVFCKSGRLTLLEVKQVDHEFRLPHGNFKLDQIARMRNWQAAGASAWVLIYFSPSKLWRALPVDHFRERVGGSWDLSSLATETLSEVFARINSNKA